MPNRRIDGARSLVNESGSTLVAIGNFDGVHRGHRLVLLSAIERARQQSLRPLVLTFHPHPAVVLGRGQQAVLTPVDRKVELLCRLDPSLRVVVEPFTMRLAQMSPRAFAEELLVECLSARVVLVGENFRFGHRRSGDLGTLRELGSSLGFAALAEGLEGDDAGPISSSRIRAAVAVGDVVGAEALLGRPHAISGSVVHGDRRGRTIGIPTANLSAVQEAMPPHGVYVCLVDHLQSGSSTAIAAGVLNIGDRPTISAGFSVEVHLLDFSGDLYGSRLRVHLVQRLRGEQKFAGLDALRAQIDLDIRDARAVIARRQSEPDAGGAWH